jgi:hypothetical protein
MKLTFLGRTYEASMDAVDVVVTSEHCTFLGQHYQRRQVNSANFRRPSSAELTFLGQHYTR